MFTQISEDFTELQTRELILAVETEFNVDLENSQFNERLGSEAYVLNLRDNLTLQILAELVELELKSREESS
ncbi:hypothetical protein GCM10007100_23850 [Roseibacillus persicicus]|uniref:Uncharacterized protein n=1 Tax=Roseibacillus persicicus TaxID=454148 RepID=A0A918WM77_9BACT|nr:hypothetical protein GCM10007100_23850 [Roseibacillus persicicus]